MLNSIKNRIRHYKDRVLVRTKDFAIPLVNRAYHAIQHNPYNMAADYRMKCLHYGMPFRFVPRIAFYVSLVSQMDHYKRIWRHIEKDKFIVLVPANLHNETTQREFPAIIELLKTENVPYKIYEHALIDMEQYPLLLTKHHDSATFPKPAGIAKSYVRYMIQGFESFAYHPRNFHFSLFLCQSNYQREKLKNALPNARCEIMGYPRLDDFFLQDTLPEAVKSYQSKTHKTILYLPSHEPRGTIRKYLSTLVNLSDEYNVIVKPHPDCFTENPTIFENLQEHENLHVVRKGSVHDWALFRLADYVFVDCGGSVFATIYTQKNILFLHNENRVNEQSMEIEDKLSREFISVYTPDDKIIRQLLASNVFEEKKPLLKKYREEFFAPVCENSGKRAADILCKELNKCLAV